MPARALTAEDGSRPEMADAAIAKLSAWLEQQEIAL